MKFRLGCSSWLTLLLVGSSIISVSPNSSTTITTTFQHNYQQPTTIIMPSLATESERILSKAQSSVVGITTNLFGKLNTNKGLNSYNNRYNNNNNNNNNNHSNINNNSKISNKIILTSKVTGQHKNNNNNISLPIGITMPVSRTTQTLRTNQNKLNSNQKDNNFWTKYQRYNRTFSYGNQFNINRNYEFKRQKQRYKRDAEVSDGSQFEIDPCLPFTVGDKDQNTFYSPDFPNNYPKNIDCTRTLEAQEGQLIRLDFRNSFDIEDKDQCKFDYLEIRDGPYGFSSLIGKYCGQNFPPIIQSKERHLWLRFHSDESIEYSGFTAVFEYISRPEGAISTNLDCIIRKDGYEGWVNHTDVPEYVLSNSTAFKIPVDCMWIIEVKQDWKIQTKFPDFELSKPNDCDKNYIDIFEEETTMDSRLKNFCGSAGEAVQSKSNILHVRFFAEPVAVSKSKFAMLYTAYRDKGIANCKDDEYDCEDATCISRDLKCNKRGNCKFQWDEENCDNEAGGQSEHVTIIIVVFGLILGGMIASFLFNCTRKLVRDQKIIREHIRQSKESKLDEMGRASAKRSGENLSVKLSPREKHSQTSLQILDDVSNRFYREIIPVSVQTSRIDIKSDPILRQHHDMVVQTSLGNDSSISDRNGGNGIGIGIGDGSGTCDMGCQTRESLFQPSSAASIVRQKSIVSSSVSPNQSQSAIRFSTFGYDTMPTTTTTINPPFTNKTAKTLSRQSTINNRTSQAIEMEELHHQHHHHHQQQQQQLRTSIGGGSGIGQIDIPTSVRPPEICHHHHQHQQHLQQQKHHGQHHIHQQPQQIVGGGGGGGTFSGKSGKQQQKLDESKVFIDIRNSAPDVIIMTSH